jgi:hypothetical protein
MIFDMDLVVLPPDDAPASRPLLAGIAADLGFVPNLAAATAASPTLLGAFDALRRAVADPTFPPLHREIAGLATGVAVDNAYGVAFHSTMLAGLGVERSTSTRCEPARHRAIASKPPSMRSPTTSRQDAARSPTTSSIVLTPLG